MPADTEARYLFKRARQEATKASEALARRAPAAEVAAHRELALRYKVRALSISAPDQVIHDALEKHDLSVDAGTRKRPH